MILVDTSIWVEHFRKGHPRLERLLEAGRVLIHPFVIGELALGHLRQRSAVLAALVDMPRPLTATDDEALGFIDYNKLFGRGIGYVDAHLLAATQLTAGSRLWTTDKALYGVAADLGVASTAD